MSVQMSDNSESDISNQAKTKDVFSLVSKLVPGYRSYAEKESLRANDSLIRKKCEIELRICRASLEQLKAQLLEEGDFEQVSKISKITDRCMKVESVCQSAVQGYSGIFQETETGQKILLSVLESDKEMAKLASRLQSTVNANLDASFFSEIINLLELCESALRERSNILRGL